MFHRSLQKVAAPGQWGTVHQAEVEAWGGLRRAARFAPALTKKLADLADLAAARDVYPPWA